MSIVETGEFTFLRKIWAAFYENIVFYAVIGVIGGIFGIAFIIYLVVSNVQINM